MKHDPESWIKNFNHYNIPVNYSLEKVIQRSYMCKDKQVLTYSHSVVTANEHKPN